MGLILPLAKPVTRFVKSWFKLCNSKLDRACEIVSLFVNVMKFFLVAGFKCELKDIDSLSLIPDAEQFSTVFPSVPSLISIAKEKSSSLESRDLHFSNCTGVNESSGGNEITSASEDSSSEHVAKLNNSASEIKWKGSVEETLNLWLLHVGVDVATENRGGNDSHGIGDNISVS